LTAGGGSQTPALSSSLSAESMRRRRSFAHLNGAFFFSAAILFVFVLLGVTRARFAPDDPAAQSLTHRLLPPSWMSRGVWTHPLGTDTLGRDILSRLIAGTRVSFLVVAITIPASLAVGMLVGVVAGFRGGMIDRVLMRIVDAQLALPAILVAVYFASVFGASLKNVVIVLVFVNWSGFARLVRGQVLTIKRRPFVEAAESLGASDTRLLVRHIAPSTIAPIVVLATVDIAAVIIAEASLSFLGVGVPIATPSWGGMVAGGRTYISSAWWLVTIPGVAIVCVALAGNVFGDWLQDALEPALRHRR
jgi:peptide/nickel transport system permease protein